jgi:hypothetical protein
MTQKTFIETYKVEDEVCDKIIRLYDKNKNLVETVRRSSPVKTWSSTGKRGSFR